MTLTEIRHRITDIVLMAGDDESAHSAEDTLRADVLKAIAAGTCENPREAARLAITTDSIDFSRWCA